jgi:hypothetical protein
VPNAVPDDAPQTAAIDRIAEKPLAEDSETCAVECDGLRAPDRVRIPASRPNENQRKPTYQELTLAVSERFAREREVRPIPHVGVCWCSLGFAFGHKFAPVMGFLTEHLGRFRPGPPAQIESPVVRSPGSHSGWAESAPPPRPEPRPVS